MNEEKQEGAVEGGSDADFHAEILGNDVLPEPILEQLRRQAEAAGLDPILVQN